MTDHPRSLSDLRSFLYGYRIGNSGPTRWYLRERASIIIAAIDGQRPFSQAVRWTARELAELDPSLCVERIWNRGEH